MASKDDALWHSGHVTDLDWAALGEAVRWRREKMRLPQNLGLRGGPAPMTTRKIERGDGAGMRPHTKRELELALDWPHGVVDAILESGDARLGRPNIAVRHQRLAAALGSKANPGDTLSFADETDLAAALATAGATERTGPAATTGPSARRGGVQTGPPVRRLGMTARRRDDEADGDGCGQLGMVVDDDAEGDGGGWRRRAGRDEAPVFGDIEPRLQADAARHVEQATARLAEVTSGHAKTALGRDLQAAVAELTRVTSGRFTEQVTEAVAGSSQRIAEQAVRGLQPAMQAAAEAQTRQLSLAIQGIVGDQPLVNPRLLEGLHLVGPRVEVAQLMAGLDSMFSRTLRETMDNLVHSMNPGIRVQPLSRMSPQLELDLPDQHDADADEVGIEDDLEGMGHDERSAPRDDDQQDEHDSTRETEIVLFPIAYGRDTAPSAEDLTTMELAGELVSRLTAGGQRSEVERAALQPLLQLVWKLNADAGDDSQGQLGPSG